MTAKEIQEVKLLRRIRSWLIEHPGATVTQIHNIFHYDVTPLYEMGLAKYKKDKDGITRWYVNASNSKPWNCFTRAKKSCAQHGE
jgi:hypothetical protein